MRCVWFLALFVSSPAHGLVSSAGGSRLVQADGSRMPSGPPPKLGTVLPFRTRVCPPGLLVMDLVEQMRALLPSEVNPQDVPEATLQWYLVDRYYDPARGARKLTEMIKWRQTFDKSIRGVSTDKVARTRKGYLHTHKDVLGRPVVVAVAARHNVMLRDLTECKALCVQVLDAALDSLGEEETSDEHSTVNMVEAPDSETQLAVAGNLSSVQQILGVFDLRRLHPACVDFDFIIFLIDTIYRNYPQKLGQVLLVEPPPLVFEAAWNIIKPQLGRHADIVRFISLRDLQREYFTADTLPPDFR